MKVKKSFKKTIIIFITVFIFSFFLINSFLLIDENNIIKNNMFKKKINEINYFFVSKMYKSNCNFSNNVIDAQTQFLKKENENLKALLNLNKSNDIYETAYVTNRLTKTWFKKISIITSSNVKKQSAVINENGLVGFVSDSFENTAQVDLLTSVKIDDGISVIIKTNNDEILGVLSSYDVSNNLFKIKDVISNSLIKRDDKVLLKSYKNTSYDDVYIGDVVKVESDNYGLSKIVWIKSTVDFNNLMYLYVVIK